MKTPSKKWMIIIAALVVLFIIGKVTQKPKEAQKEIVATEKPLTFKEQFDKKFRSSWDGSYRPIEKYLKENLNDPSSLEFDKTWSLGMNKDSTFSLKSTFRFKNTFNAVVLQAIYCKVDINGNVSDVKIE